ncbi:hypothetical protein SAMN05216330_105182 [Bradyrhizobium sp. Ghvi]|uniref:hypothetical protein n=1 Tax=Bradyrhizobium sp. Ghvi TaxID=1855319 RepID=UPI0008F2F20A|nr:hypothetical protein [Bradyrhizobium sp. Ghvi]SFO97360.1 hypothetical protein SAMN05216330_105182 [Bradyrhizobium sp. Ghvi]
MADAANIVSAEDGIEALAQLVASRWLERRSLPLIDERLSMETALRVRDKFLGLIQPLLGAPLGYKVAAITPPAQRDLGIREPLGGIYLAGMFSFANIAPIPVSYGNRPIVEAKLGLAIASGSAPCRGCGPRQACGWTRAGRG